MLIMRGGSSGVIPAKAGIQAVLTHGFGLRFLDARLRGHDGNRPLKFSVTDY
jgi:hypothetical protein